MAYLYITTPEHELVGPLAEDLVGDDVSAARMRVFTMHPERLPRLQVKTIRYRSPAANMMFGAMLGLTAGLVIGLLLMFAGFGITPILVLVAALGLGGALSRLWFGHGLAGELYRLDDAMRHGNAVIVVDVARERIAEVESHIKDRHPDVAVLGTAAEGTPPFP